jgi:hypothetical protein
MHIAMPVEAAVKSRVLLLWVSSGGRCRLMKCGLFYWDIPAAGILVEVKPGVRRLPLTV